MSDGRFRRQNPSRPGFWRELVLDFARDERAAFALEFGLCAIPFFGLVFAFCEASYVNYEADKLQDVVTAAARQVLVGKAQATAPTSASQFISQYICTPTETFAPQQSCASLFFVDIRKAQSFLNADTRNDFYTQGSAQLCYDLGIPNTIVVLRVAYALPAVFPLSIFNSAATVSNVPGLSGSYHMILAADAFKTEPYQGSYTPPSNNPSC